MSFERWMRRLGAALAPEEDHPERRNALERVSATLLIEIARADHHIDAAERETIRDAIARSSNLPAAELDEVLEAALADSDASVSLYEHAQTINHTLDKGGKIALVEQMWRVAFADGDLDGYEEYTIRKLADLFHLEHRDFMQAKLRVLESVGG